MFKENLQRSILKATSWRLTGSLVTMVVAFVLTGKAALSIGIGMIDVIAKFGLYFFHERIWDRVQFGRQRMKPVVIWFTGLSGSGKTTLGEKVYERLVARGLSCEPIDGDTVRNIFPGTGFTKEERDHHVRRVGYLASRMESHGVFVVASLISPYRESRDFVRGLCGRFVEVHLSTPLSVCEARDVKGLYSRARRGEIKNFTGVDDPYEEPFHPELSIDTGVVSVEDAVEMIVGKVLNRPEIKQRNNMLMTLDRQINV